MKRGLCIWLLVVLVAGLGQAASVNRDAARQRAVEFLAKSSSLSRAAVSVSEEELALTLVEAASSEGRYYVFNVGRDEGFVVVGGDGVLGYAERGAFGGEVPENVRGWLAGLGGQDGQDGFNGQDGQFGLGGRSAHIAQTAHIAHNPQPAHSPQPAQQPQSLPPIRPLLTTLWTQREPYNTLCPEDTPSGCVAMAMAQVMKYHEWPQDSTAAIPAYGDYEELPPALFDWEHILSGYGGNEPQECIDAVAQLVRYCGHAVEMIYGSSSTAFDQMVPIALRDYFNYDAGIRMVERQQYTAAEWETLIYDELASGRPVILSGQRMTIGHEFVCDGYDGDGFFHINWGWGGKYDGFFRLSDVNPYASGTILANKDGYTLNMAAIVGIQPDQGSVIAMPDDEDMVLTAERMRLADGTKTLKRSAAVQSFTVNVYNQQVNYTTVPATFRYGLALMRDGEIVSNSTRQTGVKTLLPCARIGRSTPQRFTFGGGLTGTFHIVPICALYEDSVVNWQPAIGSDNHYIEATITTNSVKLNEYPTMDIVVNKVTTKSEGDRMAFDVAITNRGLDYNGPLSLIVNDVTVSTVGIIIAKGASDVVSFHYIPTENGAQRYCIGYSEDDQTWLATGLVNFKAKVVKWFTVWDDSGEVTRVSLTKDKWAVVPAEAVAADFGNVVPDTIIANVNPNCLYYVADTLACLIEDGHNVVAGNYADHITLTDGYAFYCPRTFTAGSIVYERTFVRGYDGEGGGWETIILPFDVQTVTPRGHEPVDWFRSAQDAGKGFWLMTYGGGDTFDHAQTMEANRPYLIAVPGPVYGERSLTGIPVTFAADHTVVRQTALTNDGAFVGEYGQSQNAQSARLDGQDGQDGLNGQSGQFGWEPSYQLNVGGSAFVGTTRRAMPFRVRIR